MWLSSLTARVLATKKRHPVIKTESTAFALSIMFIKKVGKNDFNLIESPYGIRSHKGRINLYNYICSLIIKQSTHWLVSVLNKVHSA